MKQILIVLLLFGVTSLPLAGKGSIHPSSTDREANERTLDKIGDIPVEIMAEKWKEGKISMIEESRPGEKSYAVVGGVFPGAYELHATSLEHYNTNSENNAFSALVPTESVDLEVEKKVDEENPKEGKTIKYEIKVKNNGPGVATNISINETLPSGLTFESIYKIDDGTYDLATGIWTIPSIKKGKYTKLTIKASVDVGTAGTTIMNCAKVVSVDQVDDDSSNDQDCASIQVKSDDKTVDLEIKKKVDKDNPDVNSTIVYEIKVKNKGEIDATNIWIDVPLPAGVTFVKIEENKDGGTYDSSAGKWFIPGIKKDKEAKLKIKVSVNPNTAGSTLTNCAKVMSVDQVDDNPSNDQDCASVEVKDGSGGSDNNCCGSSGKPIAITMKYTGQSCAASNNSQINKSSCSGDPRFASSVYIVVNGSESSLGGEVYFSGTVGLNGQFTFTTANAGVSKFINNTFIHILSKQGGSELQKIKIHMSCSEPIVPGEQYGAALLTSATFADGAACLVLPIQLLSFEAQPGKNDVFLQWETATELNNSHFEIQRSADGRNFENIGRIRGNGTTSEVIAYDFTDNSPLQGKSFYRLKQVDFAGTYEYSYVEEVTFGANSELKLYPNPVALGSEINILGQKIQSVKIFNILGQLVIDQIYDQPQTRVTISSANLTQGLYITRVNGVDEMRVVIR